MGGWADASVALGCICQLLEAWWNGAHPAGHEVDAVGAPGCVRQLSGEDAGVPSKLQDSAAAAVPSKHAMLLFVPSVARMLDLAC